MLLIRGKTTALNPVRLINGSITSDNAVSVLDYGALVSCFGAKQNTSTCLNPVTADLNDDGVVDGIDYNIFLREHSYLPNIGDVEPGDAITPTLSPQTTPSPTIPLQQNSSLFGITDFFFISTAQRDKTFRPLNYSAFQKAIDDASSHQLQWIRTPFWEWEEIKNIQNNNGIITITWNDQNLAQFDNAVNYAQSKGLKIILVTNVPSGWTKNYSFTDYQSVAHEYYGFLAKRYGSKISVWQIYNEPNITNFRDNSDIRNSLIANT